MSKARLAFCLTLTAGLLSCSTIEERPPVNVSNAENRRVDGRDRRLGELRAAIPRIEPFFRRMGEPGPADWLESHNESGQTFEEYLESDPVVPAKDRQKLYIIALGQLGPAQKRMVDTAEEFLSVFYDLPVERLPPKSLDLGQPNARRNRITGIRQIRTGYILDEVLLPTVPPDAAALIAFTREDLYPNESMNYVFGQASLANRVGVWSLARLDDHADQMKFLSRTLKIAAHETGHMFSMRHCTKYECLMSGTNHLGETDRRPIDACPECTAKICWLSNVKMAERYTRLAEFCRRYRLVTDAAEFQRKASSVG